MPIRVLAPEIDGIPHHKTKYKFACNPTDAGHASAPSFFFRYEFDASSSTSQPVYVCLNVATTQTDTTSLGLTGRGPRRTKSMRTLSLSFFFALHRPVF